MPDTLQRECVCQPGPTACGDAAAPACAAACPDPNNEICLLDATGGACECRPINLDCDQTGPPVCDGACPNDGSICIDIGGSCRCVTQDCDQGPLPECGGICPGTGQSCVEDMTLQECVCVDDSTPCDQTGPPECGGVCLVGEICEDDAQGNCRCVPDILTTPCDQTGPPVCGGTCPVEGDECIDDLGGRCVCSPPPIDTCSDAIAPECNGLCPNTNETCDPILVCDPTTGQCGEICTCTPLEEPCENLIDPVCDGACPPFYRCESPGVLTDCFCQPCDTVLPNGPNNLLFLTKARFAWDEDPCAEVYNTYRGDKLEDVDDDKIADDYGVCLHHDLLVPWDDDFTVPLTRQLFNYLATSENGLGETDLMFTSSGALRPNLNPCP
jgi:hypothetical protein